MSALRRQDYIAWLHFYNILRGAHLSSLQRCMVYDFLPEEPTAPATAASLLSGRSVKGKVRQRAMRRIPPRRCTWIGTAAVQDVRFADLTF